MSNSEAPTGAPAGGDTEELASIGRRANSAAHELNNLFAIIMGNVELMAEEIPKTSELLPMLELIRSAAGRGKTLTAELQLVTEQVPAVPHFKRHPHTGRSDQ